MKRCPKCERWLDLSAFTVNRAKRDGLQVSCRECQRAYVRQHYERNTQYYVDKAARLNKKRLAEMRRKLQELKNVPCADCGRRYPPCVMDFDHVRGIKLFNVGQGLQKSAAVFHDEVAKCDVVCANCHRLRTQERLAKGGELLLEDAPGLPWGAPPAPRLLPAAWPRAQWHPSTAPVAMLL